MPVHDMPACFKGPDMKIDPFSQAIAGCMDEVNFLLLLLLLPLDARAPAS